MMIKLKCKKDDDEWSENFLVRFTDFLLSTVSWTILVQENISYPLYNLYRKKFKDHVHPEWEWFVLPVYLLPTFVI